MAWYNEIGNDFDTVLSSRIRFARNLSAYPFGNKLKENEAREIISAVSASLDGKGFRKIDFDDISPTEAASYVEKHFVSREFAAKKTPHSLLINENSGTAIMICEEDHIRLQSILPGLALEEAFKIACEYDDILDSVLDIAYNEDLGYLTHCPTNLGTGMRASVMMFLPALTMANRISSLASELSKIGLTMRGMYGEGSESRGCLYQISNQITLGITEEDTLKKLGDVISQINEQERKLRSSIKGENLERLRDKVLRSEGILKYAHMLSSAEFIEHFSTIRLGIALGIVTDISYAVLGDLLITTLPAVLTLSSGDKPKNDAERDRARAKLVKNALGK
ncbi:MAG: ATP--guanido phosphotransferase [Ruminococcaceae bacterium]|nr:ATP--guanido phosphotransferase [Oscillospiraceae bacterium]